MLYKPKVVPKTDKIDKYFKFIFIFVITHSHHGLLLLLLIIILNIGTRSETLKFGSKTLIVGIQ